MKTSVILGYGIVLWVASTCICSNGCSGAGPSTPSAPTPSVSVKPQTALVAAQQTFQFTAAVQNSTNTGVTWSVDGIAGGNSSTGTISVSGLYAAPATSGSHAIIASSAADSSATATASITIIDPNAPRVAVDFGNRSDTRFPVPKTFLNAQWSIALPSAQLSELAGAGFSGMRLHANIELVYNTQTPDWSWIDPTITALQAAGLRPVVQMVDTPPWLVPTVQGCPNADTVPPSDVTSWAQLAASFVAHFDQRFPGFVQDYEIWNEPDLPSFCVYPNTDSNRLSEYQSLYAVAASKMHAQAAHDGMPIRVGGPTIISPSEVSVWIPALLSNSSTAPYVDFVSYHRYLSQQSDITAGMTWDDASTGSWPLYNRTQDPNTGEAAVFSNVSRYVRAGSQPNAATTPIYFDEYNEDSAFALDCCRNSPVYSPIWNSLVVADVLNAVYTGVTAVPTRISYYSSSNPPFCLFGTLNTSMDCTSGAYQMYPQYLTYQLLMAKNYLGMASGAYMATSISPSFSSASIEATAFYNPAGDSIVIINPTATDFSQVVLQVQNSGLSGAQATLYHLNSSAQQISSQALTMVPISGDLTGVLPLPRYSIVGISLR